MLSCLQKKVVIFVNAIFEFLLIIILLVWLLFMIGLTWFASFAGYEYCLLVWAPVLFWGRRSIFKFAKLLLGNIVEGFKEGLENAKAKKVTNESRSALRWNVS